MGRKRTFYVAMAVVAALLFVLGACAAPGATSPAAADPKVAALESRVAALETRVIAQQSQLGALTTGGARPAGTVTVTPTPPPTPTPVPTVAGIAVSGATRGLATAPVTITEYSDFL